MRTIQMAIDLVLFSFLFVLSASCGVFVDDGPWDLDVVFGTRGPDLSSGDVYVLWPDKTSFEASRQVRIWVLESGVYKCEDLFSGKVRPEHSVLASLSITLPASGKTVLENVPQTQAIFFAESLGQDGITLFHACGIEVARKKAGIILQLVGTAELCNTDRDCDDYDVCTRDICDNRTCTNERITKPGAEGPQGDSTCSNGIDDDCDGKTDSSDPNCNPCTSTSDCDDDNDCTDDSCKDGSCDNQAVENGTPCDDGLYCNGSDDSCKNGSCSEHGQHPCAGPDGDGDCKESCNEKSRTCTDFDPDESSCDDGNDCTSDDKCMGGVCSGQPGLEDLKIPGTCANGIDDDCDEETDGDDDDCHGCTGNGQFSISRVCYSNSSDMLAAAFVELDLNNEFEEIAILTGTGGQNPDKVIPLKIPDKSSYCSLIDIGYEVHNYGYDIESADFNGDGKTDIAVSSRGDSYYLTVFYRTEGDNVEFNKQEFEFQDKWVERIIAVDFNKDNYSDLAVTFKSLGDENKVGVLLNQNGNFSSIEHQYIACPGSRSVKALKVADVNSDSALDIVVGCETDGSNGAFKVLLGSPEDPGSFSTSGFTCQIGQSIVDIVTGDFVSDGTIDLALLSRDDKKVYIVKGTTGGAFDCINAKVSAISGFGSSLDRADFNGDGILDLVVALQYSDLGKSTGDNKIEVLLGAGQDGVGDGQFVAPSSILELKDEDDNKFMQPVWVYARDLDKDGMADIIAGTAALYGSDGLIIFWGLGICQ